MKHYSVVQGSEEWHRLRIGIPTASEFDRIITPKQWKETSTAARTAYAMKLITERALGVSLDEVTTSAMQHGKDWEHKARAGYELMANVDVEPCGFCVIDSGICGASPDGFVGTEGSLEIKCPEKPEIHMRNLVCQAEFVQEHFVQTQGQQYVTGRKWTDLVSYFMGLPMACVRVFPSAGFQTKLDMAILSFSVFLKSMEDTARRVGVNFADDGKVPWDDDTLVTQEDVTAILKAQEAK